MTLELIACAILAIASSRINCAIAVHYGAFFLVNLAFLGVEFADSSLLAMVFGVLAVVDILLALYGRREVLYVSAAASLALCFESIGNGGWLLTHSAYLSVAVNAVIIVSLVRERMAWTSGKSGRY